MRKLVVSAELCAILVAAIFMFPTVTETFVNLNAVGWQMLSRRHEVPAFRESGRPRGGEQVLPREVQIMVGLLRQFGVDSYRFSAGIAAKGPIMQRLVEGAYPIKVSPASPYLVMFAGEPLPAGCSRAALQEGVGLAYCR